MRPRRRMNVDVDTLSRSDWLSPMLLDYRLSKKPAGELREACRKAFDLGRRGNLSDYIISTECSRCPLLRSLSGSTSEPAFDLWVNPFTQAFQFRRPRRGPRIEDRSGPSEEGARNGPALDRP